MTKIRVGQIWRAKQLVVSSERHPVFITKSSYTRDGEKLAHRRLQPDDKIIIKDIDDVSIWITDSLGNNPIFMIRVMHGGTEYRIANAFLHKYFVLDDPDSQETT